MGHREERKQSWLMGVVRQMSGWEERRQEAVRQASEFILARTGQLPRVQDGRLYITQEQYAKLCELVPSETVRRYVPGGDHILGIPLYREEEP